MLKGGLIDQVFFPKGDLIILKILVIVRGVFFVENLTNKQINIQVLIYMLNCVLELQDSKLILYTRTSFLLNFWLLT